MATCVECGKLLWSEYGSGLCRTCWAIKPNSRRRVPRTPSPCPICANKTSKLESGRHREKKWVYDFLGGCLCPRCECSLSVFGRGLKMDWIELGRRDPQKGEQFILAWMGRLLTTHARHKRNWLASTASPKSSEHKARISESVKRFHKEKNV